MRIRASIKYFRQTDIYCRGHAHSHPPQGGTRGAGKHRANEDAGVHFRRAVLLLLRPTIHRAFVHVRVPCPRAQVFQVNSIIGGHVSHVVLLYSPLATGSLSRRSHAREAGMALVHVYKGFLCFSFFSNGIRER